ncbi:metallophosphoesterase [Pelagovum pacificum]|uniref:metallophosphoesterase n=1 Tax=Pelagovum pacificum TaxID=2588711 RepID=UPI001E45D176|nr:metallophosphoesterase [Pelagovum pacificum]
MTDPIYTVGDIHGFNSSLETALSLIEADGGPDAQIIFLGDYVDRGPDSRAVIQRLFEGHREGRNWQFLLGNHDRMFLKFVTEGKVHDSQISSGKGWLHPALGGNRTLASYIDDAALEHLLDDGLDPVPQPDLDRLVQAARLSVPPEHLEFLTDRPRLIETDEHIFVHAGIRPGVALDEQDEEDLVWIRDGFLDYDAPFPKLVVHGHTALDTPEHFGNRIDFDGGAGYGRPLVPGVFDGSEWFTLTEDGRQPLRPPHA